MRGLLIALLFAGSALAQYVPVPFTAAGGGGGGNTFTLVSHTDVGGGSGFTCNATCSITIPATAAGHVAMLYAVDTSGVSGKGISSVTGAGGTWVAPAGCQIFSVTEGQVSCAYNLSLGTGGVTSLSVTLSTGASTASIDMFYWEASVSPGPAVFDTSGTATDGVSGTTQTGPTLTLTGSKDWIVTALTLSGSSTFSVGAPWGNALTGFFATALADNENTASGTGPTWTLGTARTGVASSMALK